MIDISIKHVDIKISVHYTFLG